MRFRTLDLNLLRVFDAVMDERHVTRAAERLAMTQPAASNALRRLRDALGDDLFVPGPTGVAPTRRAEALAPTVREALRALQQAIEPPSFDPRVDARAFTLAMTDATAAVLMPVLMRRWADAGAVATLTVVAIDSRDPRPMLDHGAADAAVGFFPEVAQALAADPDAGAARLEVLYRNDYVAVMRAGHALATRAAFTLDDYCDARHLRVNFAGRPRGYVDDALARLGRSRRTVLTVDHFSTAACVVGGTDLVTTLPRGFVRATDPGHALACRALPFDVTPIDVGLLWHRRHAHDAAQRWLRAELKAAGERIAARHRAAAGPGSGGDADRDHAG